MSHAARSSEAPLNVVSCLRVDTFLLSLITYHVFTICETLLPKQSEIQKPLFSAFGVYKNQRQLQLRGTELIEGSLYE